MSTYSNNAQVLEELKKAPALNGTTDISDSALARYREESFATINTYLNSNYSLPIVNAQDLIFLRKLEIDLTIWRYAKVKNITEMIMIGGDGTRTTQRMPVQRAYDEAMATLKALQKGEITLISVGSSAGGFNGITGIQSCRGVYSSEDQW